MDNNATASRPVGRRLGNRKDRTGCITCKARRIKCDEGKPACRRCTSTGRKCDGYKQAEVLLFRRRDGSPASNGYGAELDLLRRSSPGAAFGGVLLSSEEEHRAFGYFAHVGAFYIAGQADVDFWSRLLPQRAHVDPAVRHALVAIGSLLIQADDASSSSSGSSPRSTSSDSRYDLAEPRTTFAMQQYNKAIQATIQTIGQGHGDLTLAVITCILFFCIEALQGHEDEALKLFEKGKRALAPRRLSPSPPPPPPAGSGRPVLTDAALQAIFTRLSVQCGMFGGNSEDEWEALCERGAVAPIPMPTAEIVSIAQARNELYELSGLVQNIAKLKWEPTPVAQFANMSTHLGLAQRRQNLDAAMQHWRRRLDRFTDVYLPKIEDANDTIAVSTLIQHHIMLRVWLAGSLALSEMVYDDYFELFATLIAEASSCLDLIQRTGKMTYFTFELGCIPLLYWSALKCRHPILRRQALSLLRRSVAQEGLWSRDIMVQVVERVLQLEEGAGDEYVDPSPEAASAHEGAVDLPPENRRIKEVATQLRTVVDGRQGDYADFYSLPLGLDGPWSVTREFFTV